MILKLFHPAVANRDCSDCLLYDYNEETGQRRIGRDGKPEPRIDACPPLCRTSKGCPKGTPEHPRSLTPENQRCNDHYRECRAVGQWPNDPVVRRNAAVIREIEDQLEKKNRIEFEAALITATMVGARG